MQVVTLVGVIVLCCVGGEFSSIGDSFIAENYFCVNRHYRVCDVAIGEKCTGKIVYDICYHNIFYSLTPIDKVSTQLHAAPPLPITECMWFYVV